MWIAPRHHLIFRDVRENLHHAEQGFLTDDGRFVSRQEGAKIAYECGQIKEPKTMLYSEDCIPLGDWVEEVGKEKIKINLNVGLYNG
jgi:hypothetical protein